MKLAPGSMILRYHGGFQERIVVELPGFYNLEVALYTKRPELIWLSHCCGKTFKHVFQSKTRQKALCLQCGAEDRLAPVNMQFEKIRVDEPEKVSAWLATHLTTMGEPLQAALLSSTILPAVEELLAHRASFLSNSISRAELRAWPKPLHKHADKLSIKIYA